MGRGFAYAGIVALGLARGPGCGDVDDPNGGPNAPCTRRNDCQHDLICSDGVCRDPNAPEAAAPAPIDAGSD